MSSRAGIPALNVPSAGEFIEMPQTGVERMPSAHREPGQRAMTGVGLRAVSGLDHRNYVLDELVLESGVVRAAVIRARAIRARVRGHRA